MGRGRVTCVRRERVEVAQHERQMRLDRVESLQDLVEVRLVRVRLRGRGRGRGFPNPNSTGLGVSLTLTLQG